MRYDTRRIEVFVDLFACRQTTCNFEMDQASERTTSMQKKTSIHACGNAKGFFRCRRLLTQFRFLSSNVAI